MITVTLYLRNDCPECDQALADLQSLQEVVPHHLVTVNASSDPALMKKYDHLPAIEIGPYKVRPPFNRQDLQIMLSAARDRVDQLQRVDQAAYDKRLNQGHTLSSSDKISVWLAKHYLLVVNLVLALYVGLPFLAPVLAKENQTGLANVIYKVFSPLCHQLAFRSFFLFGEQAYYPRELAGIPNVITYETIANSSAIDQGDSEAIIEAKLFIGNETVGYKIALCERCIAMYGFMLLFGLIYGLFGRRFPPISFLAFVIVGLVPIGLDGTSQLPSLMPWLENIIHLPMRESTPFFRVFTGALFGIAIAWYILPLMEKTAIETRALFQRKLAVVAQASSAKE